MWNSTYIGRSEDQTNVCTLKVTRGGREVEIGIVRGVKLIRRGDFGERAAIFRSPVIHRYFQQLY